jgi:hypothetical protein
MIDMAGESAGRSDGDGEREVEEEEDNVGEVGRGKVADVGGGESSAGSATWDAWDGTDDNGSGRFRGDAWGDGEGDGVYAGGGMNDALVRPRAESPASIAA